MPEPKTMLVFTWESVYEMAYEASRDKEDRDPTRKEVMEIFETVTGQDIADDEGYFLSIRTAVNDHYGTSV